MTTYDTTPIYAGIAPPATVLPPAKSKGMAAALSSALRQGQPGNWASDHAAEAQQFTGWNYIAVNMLCEQLMQADVFCYADDSPAKRARRKSLRMGNRKAYVAETEGDALPEDHRLVQLLKRPSRQQSGASFRYEYGLQIRLTGNCLIWNVPSKGGRVAERFVIPTAVAEPVQPTRDLPRGGYRIQPRSAYGSGDGWMGLGGYWQAIGQVIPAEQIQAIRKPHPIFKDDGYSPLAAASLETDTANQVSRSRWSHVKNAINPSAAVTIEEDPGPDELARFATLLSQKYAGSENAGKIMLVAGGKTVTPLGTTPRDMDYGEAWEQYRDFLLFLHGTPPALFNGGSYAQLYAALKQLTTMVVQPMLDLYAEEETEQLAPYFGEGLTVEAIAAGVNDEELLERQLGTETAGGGRVRTLGEMRTLRGLPLYGDKRDEEPFAPQPAPAMQGGQPAAAAMPTTTAAPETIDPAAEAEQEIKVSADLVLNGAQITAATGIVTLVAAGEIPRDAGLGQLTILFNLTPQQAESIMGSAGTSTPTTPNPRPAVEQDEPELEPVGVGEEESPAKRNGNGRNGKAKHLPGGERRWRGFP
jgi:phage portal protein BeeE